MKLKRLFKKPLINFPPGDVVAREWRLSVEGMALLPGSHEAQALVRLAGGRAVVLKRLRRESLIKDRAKAERILGAVAGVARADGVDVAAPLARRGERDYLLEWEGRLFYLMRFVDGARPSFGRAEDVAAVMGALGRLHRAGARLGEGAAADLGVLVEKTISPRYDVWLGALRSPAAGLGMRLAVRGAERASAMVEAAWALAPRPRVKSSLAPAVLCHGDTHENNFLVLEARFGGAGAGEPLHRAAHLDIESFEIDAAVTDLVVPLHYLGYFTRWEAAGLRRALEAYERERRLGRAERDYLAAQLMLPRHWLRGMKSLLKKGAGLRDYSAWAKRLRSLRDMDRQRECVEALFRP